MLCLNIGKTLRGVDQGNFTNTASKVVIHFMSCLESHETRLRSSYNLLIITIMSIPKFIIDIIDSEINKSFPDNYLGRPRKTDNKYIIEKIFRVLRTGMQWRELDSSKLSPKTINNYFNKWSNIGIFHRSFRYVINFIYSHTNIKSKYYATDTSFIKNIFGIDLLGKNPTDRGRKATKISVVVDNNGIPLSLCMFPANRNDCTLLEETLKCNVIKNKKKYLYADKGYDSKKCRLIATNYGYKEGISKRLTWNRIHNSKRCIVENFFAWVKQYRRLILRYDNELSRKSIDHL